MCYNNNVPKRYKKIKGLRPTAREELITMTKKKTIVEMYAEVKAFLEENGATDEMVQFISDRSDMHAKKNSSRKPTKEQEANAELKAKIIEAMEDNKFYTVTQIQKLVGADSFNKINALVKQLLVAELVVRTEEKGRAYFSKA